MIRLLFTLWLLGEALTAAAGPPERIAVDNAEDLTLLADGRSVIASSLAGLSRGAHGAGAPDQQGGCTTWTLQHHGRAGCAASP